MTTDRQQIARETAKKWWLDYVHNSIDMFSVLKNQQRGDWVIVNPDEGARILTDYAAVRALEQSEGWVSVKTSLPEFGVEVLTFGRNGIRSAKLGQAGSGKAIEIELQRGRKEIGWDDAHPDIWLTGVTYWKPIGPLPSPPKSEETANG